MSATLFALERNLVVLASAGTGKTHGLVGAYLHVALGLSRLGGARPHDPVAPDRIVATTFSRRAAAELRSRLSDELDRLVSAPDLSRYAADLRAASDACGVSFDPKLIAARAATARSKLHTARVTTLHAFAHEIVRAHALELGLPPALALMNEEEERELRERAVDIALGAFVKAEPSAAAELSAIAGTGERLEDTLLSTVVELEESGGVLALSAATGDDVELERLRREVLRHAEALTAELAWAEPARAVLATRAEDPDTLGELFSRRTPRSPSPAIHAFLAFRNDAPQAARKNFDRGAALARAFALRARFGPNAEAAVRLLHGVERASHRLCERSAKLGFGGVLRLARDLLRDRPEVASSLSSGIDALLVDEFQDTSRVQCELVSLLWDGAPAARTPGTLPALGAFRPTGLCVVGDRKQSIYAFRGADVGVFSRFCVALAGEAARDALGLPREVVDVPTTPTADLVALRANYRSAPELLAFANAFSEALLQPASTSVYEARYVDTTERLLPRPGSSANPLSPRVTWVRPDNPKKSTPAEDARLVAARVASITRGPSHRAFRDVAVLAQTNDMLDAVAQELARLSVPHVVAGRGFFRAREVRDLVALLTTVVRPLDRRALLEVARGPWAAASDRALLGLSEPGGGIAPVDEWGQGTRRFLIPPDELEPLRAVADVIVRLRRAVDRIGPAGVLREAVRALDLEATLVMLPRGVQRVANVRKLIAMAAREPSARALLERIERAERGREQEAATFSDEDDAVRLLTVHASKGLDFRVVVIPQVAVDGASRGGSPIAIDRAPDGSPVLSAKLAQAGGRALEPPSHRRAALAKRARERADHRRLAYVAITRASEEMIFVGTAGTSRGADEASIAFALQRVQADPAFGWTLRVEAPAAAPPIPAPVASTTELHVTSVDVAARVVRHLPIATTALADFHHCPRRFQLAHLLELPERATASGANARTPASMRTGELDAREEGILTHRVLELVDAACFGSAGADAAIDARLDRDGVPDGVSRTRVRERALGFLGGAYAKRVARAGAEVVREAPFVLSESAGETQLVLKGSIDLLVRWPDGRVDVVDYKRARGPALEPHAFQLDAYTLAVRAGGAAPDPPTSARATQIRAGIVFLGGAAGEPRFRDPPDDEAVRATLASLVRRFVDARTREAFPRIARPGCRALKCGYEPLCHPEGQGTQLGLFG